MQVSCPQQSKNQNIAPESNGIVAVFESLLQSQSCCNDFCLPVADTFVWALERGAATGGHVVSAGVDVFVDSLVLLPTALH